MASMGIKMGLTLVLILMLWNNASAQSSCAKAIMGLAPCLNFVTGNSSTPSSSCCSQLSSVVQSQPRCLCTLLNGAGSSIGITINQTLALSLPGACNVQTPPVSQCNAANGPSPSSAPETSPADSIPADSSDDTPEITPSQSEVPAAGLGSKTIPSINGAVSGESVVNSPLHAMVLLSIVFCASTAVTF